MKCPFKSYAHFGFIECIGQSCAFADKVGNCLVQQALSCYVNAERTRVAEKTERIRVAEEAKRIRRYLTEGDDFSDTH